MSKGLLSPRFHEIYTTSGQIIHRCQRGPFSGRAIGDEEHPWLDEGQGEDHVRVRASDGVHEVVLLSQSLQLEEMIAP